MKYKFSILPDHFFQNCKVSDFDEKSYIEISDINDLQSRIKLKIILQKGIVPNEVKIIIGKINKPLIAQLIISRSEIEFGDGSCGLWDIRSMRGSKFILNGNNYVSNGVKCVLEPNSLVQIGKECMFSDEVLIQCGSQHSLICLDEKRQINIEKSSINIGDHVWLARRSNVNTSSRSLHIGRGSIVGLNSTLTRTIPETSLAVGCPAKIIRSNISWSNQFKANPKELERIYSMFI